MTHSDSVVNNLVYIPRHFFTPDIIIQRKPLASSARRAGWIGCNINIQKIPQSGKIYIIRNSVVQDVNNVVEQSKKAELLETKLKERGWLFDIIRCVESVKTEYFTLAQVYSFESILQKLHPENNNIRAKIRQQLQVLRDSVFV
jgi:type II restriction enzyme